MRASAWVTLALFASASAARAAREPLAAVHVVAVLELRSKLDPAERRLIDAAYLTDRVRAKVLTSAPGVEVMTRENMLVLLRASGKELADCEGECEVETGRRLGADGVVSGEVLRFGAGFRASLRLHDTVSGKLLAGSVATGETPEALEQEIGPAVVQLFAPVAPPAGALPAGAIAGREKTRSVEISTDAFGANFEVAVRHEEDLYRCVHPVARGASCRLDEVPLGSAELVVKGSASFQTDLELDDRNSSVRIQRSNAPLIAGASIFLAGGLALGGGLKIDNGAGRLMLILTGSTLLFAGGVTALVGAFLPWTADESPLLREHRAAAAIVPVPRGAAGAATVSF